MKPEHYEYIEAKWGDLMHTIANNISGDSAYSHEDRVQALWIAVIDAIDGFTRQKQGINGSIDEFINTPSFNKYIKTVLWNCKNKIGANIAKKQRIQGSIISYTPMQVNKLQSILKLDDGDFTSLIEPEAPPSSGELEYRDFLNTLEEDEKQIVSTMIDNPKSMLENGRINLKSISEITGFSLNKVNKLYSNLFFRLKAMNK